MMKTSHNIILLLKLLFNPFRFINFCIQYYIIKKSNLFDWKFYKKQFQNDSPVGKPLVYYIMNCELDKSPSPFFNQEYYINQIRERKLENSLKNLTPLYHFIKHGERLRISPHPYFNDMIKTRNSKIISLYREFIQLYALDNTEKTQISIENKLSSAKIYNSYKQKKAKEKITSEELKIQSSICFPRNPLISIIIPVYKPHLRLLKEAIKSVVKQSYTNWQICISASCCDTKVKKYLTRLSQNHTQIIVKFTEERLHISENSNSCLSFATGDYVALLDQDDLLYPNALYEVVKYINIHPDTEILYSDEDKVSENSRFYSQPFFKPDWSPETFLNIMYTCHLTVYRRDIMLEVGGFRNGYEGAQDYDLMLRATEIYSNIVHIPEILYSWRITKNSIAATQDSKPYALSAVKKAKLDALERRGLRGDIEPSHLFPGQFYITLKPLKDFKVSIIIPTKDNHDLLSKCISSIEMSTYLNYELLVIDNGSINENVINYLNILREKPNSVILEYPSEFNYSKMNNMAAQKATGDFLLFLNDDIEVRQPDWIERLLGYAQLQHVGAVGAQLLFPETLKIQHCGLINYYNGPGHAFYNMSSDKIYHYGRNDSPYNYLAITAACLLIKKSRFIRIEGFNEDLKVAYNDVDLCFKLFKRGYFNVCNNMVKLFHHESVSRGSDDDDLDKKKRLLKEKALLYELHPDLYQFDPFYNKHLTHVRNDFGLE